MIVYGEDVCTTVSHFNQSQRKSMNLQVIKCKMQEAHVVFTLHTLSEVNIVIAEHVTVQR